MSELYHIKKKKNPFDETESKNVSTFGSSISSIGKKAKSTVDRMQSSSGYQKVKLAQKLPSASSKPSLGSKINYTVSNIGKTTTNRAKGFAIAAKKNSNSNKPSQTYVSDEYQEELEYNSKSNEYPNKINEPKKLRKKLNSTKLRDIVGPKRR